MTRNDFRGRFTEKVERLLAEPSVGASEDRHQGGRDVSEDRRDVLVTGHGDPVPEVDPVNHPAHYTRHPSGIECIQITEHMGFCLGNAVKYIWRADLKNDAIEDLRKAKWYIDREIQRRKSDDDSGL
jgi:hypothetical protein